MKFLFAFICLYLFMPLLIGQGIGYSLDDIKSKLDSAHSFESELKVKTAHRYFQTLEEPASHLVESDTLNAEAWKIYGLVSAKVGTIGDAYEAFKKSVLLDSVNLENQIEYIRFTLNTAQNLAREGQQYRSQQWLQSSFDVLAVSIYNYPTNSELHELAGDIYASTNDIDNCTYHYQKAFDRSKKKELALKLYRLYAVNKDYENEVKMAGILSQRHGTYAEFYAVQAQLGLKDIERDLVGQSRYLPGVKRTAEMAINLKSHNPSTYLNYFEIIKLSIALNASFRVPKTEIIKVINNAVDVFEEVDLVKADIMVNGAQLLQDLEYKNEACKVYTEARGLNTNKTSNSSNIFCK